MSELKSIESVSRGMVRKWIRESKVTRYMTRQDEDQLVEVCQHAYEIGLNQRPATALGPAIKRASKRIYAYGIMSADECEKIIAEEVSPKGNKA